MKVMSPSLRPMTESWVVNGKSAGWKKRILSSSSPSFCPLLKSNTHSFTASLALLPDDNTISNPTFPATFVKKVKSQYNTHQFQTTWIRLGIRFYLFLNQTIYISQVQQHDYQFLFIFRCLITNWKPHSLLTGGKKGMITGT